MTRNRLTLGIVLVLALMLVAGLTGCKQAAESAVEGAIEESTGVDVDTEDNTVTYETEDGSTVEVTGEQEDVPEGFPSDMPVYDADIESSSKITSGDGTGFYVGLVTDDPYEDVFDWYKSELEDAGWEILAEVNTGDSGARSGIITVSNGTSEGGVTFAEDGDVTRIAISINSK